MNFELRLLIIVLCLLFLVLTFRMVAKGRIQIKYSMLWMLLAIVMLLFSVFPQMVYGLADFFGFETPANFIFMMAVFFLLLIAMSLSVIVSWQSAYIRSLVQSEALLKKNIAELAESSDSHKPDGVAGKKEQPVEERHG